MAVYDLPALPKFDPVVRWLSYSINHMILSEIDKSMDSIIASRMCSLFGQNGQRVHPAGQAGRSG